MLLLPLKLSGMKGMKKMSACSRRSRRSTRSIKTSALRDPRKAEQNEEVMALYKKHGVNPLGAGCMPMVLQIPFFFAFYKVLSVASKCAGRRLALGYGSFAASTAVRSFCRWSMVVTQFILQRMTPTHGADPAQQKMMMFMPLMFGFMFFKASAGLVLYWLTSNLVGIAQQGFINRITPAPSCCIRRLRLSSRRKRKARK